MKPPDADIRVRLQEAARTIEFSEVPIGSIIRRGRRRLVRRSIGVGVAVCALVIVLVGSLTSLSGLGGGEGSVIREGLSEGAGLRVGVRAAVLQDAVAEFDLEAPVRVLDRICEVTDPTETDVRCHEPLSVSEQGRLESALTSPASGTSTDVRFVSSSINPSLEALARRGIVLLGPVDHRGELATTSLVLPPEVFDSIRYVAQRYRAEIDKTGTWAILGRECAAGCP